MMKKWPTEVLFIYISSAFVAGSILATTIPVDISQRGKNVVAQNGVRICTASGSKSRGLSYGFTGYQVPAGLTFYGAQACEYGNTQRFSYQLGWNMNSFADGTVISNPNMLGGFDANLQDPAMISKCHAMNWNFQGGSYPFLQANSNGDFYVCISGMVE